MPVAHVAFGTNDLKRGAQFYDAVLAEFGGTRLVDRDRAIAWRFPEGGVSIGITYPFDGAAANVGNGTMIALMADGEDQVRRVHAAALANGGSCEGPPGLRPNGMFAAYYRDPDGNKLNAFCIPSPAA
jgi:catechol 2,3-dioxygenase-like lactoylglutathione lyase family enzyme